MNWVPALRCYSEPREAFPPGLARAAAHGGGGDEPQHKAGQCPAGGEERWAPHQQATSGKWHGKKISLVCVQAGDDKDIFVFVVPRSVLPDAPATETPQFASVGGMMTAAWSVGDQLYLLASHADEELLRRYL